MEKDEETPDDPSNHYGGIIGMDRIQEKTDELIRCIQQGEVYERYEKALAIIEQHQDLKDKINQFCGLMFRLNSENSEIDLFEETDRVEREYQELQKIPEVNAYLEAELELCRLLKSIERKINESIEIHLPE